MSCARFGKAFADHNIVRHMRGEYVNKENPAIHTNTIESLSSVFKRGMKGVYQHCAHNHLHRYLAELDFRYNNRKALGVEDSERADKLLKGFQRQAAHLRNDYCLNMAGERGKRRKRSPKGKHGNK